MEEISLEHFLRDTSFDKSMVVIKDGSEICKVINDENLLLELVVPQMENCSLEQSGESLESMQSKAEKIAQTMKMDS